MCNDVCRSVICGESISIDDWVGCSGWRGSDFWIDVNFGWWSCGKNCGVCLKCLWIGVFNWICFGWCFDYIVWVWIVIFSCWL